MLLREIQQGTLLTLQPSDRRRDRLTQTLRQVFTREVCIDKSNRNQPRQCGVDKARVPKVYFGVSRLETLGNLPVVDLARVEGQPSWPRRAPATSIAFSDIAIADAAIAASDPRKHV